MGVLSAYMPVCLGVNGTRGSQERASDLLELEFWVWVRPYQVLRIAPGSSARAGSALSLSAISLVP